MRTLLLAAPLIVFVGCGSAPSGTDYIVRDSLGIEIVENGEAQWREQEGWQVSAMPSIVIGQTTGSPVQIFNRIRGALRLDDGRVVVLDYGSAELRFYAADGTHLISVGGRGQGPGEFQGPSLSLMQDADSLLVYDGGLSRLTAFGHDGQYLSSQSIVPIGDPPPPLRLYQAIGVVPTEGYVLLSNGSFANMRPTPTVYWDSFPNLVYGFDGRTVLDTVGFSGMEITATAQESGPALWGITSKGHVYEGTLYLSHGRPYEIQVYESGTGLRRLIRRQVEAMGSEEADRRLLAFVDSIAVAQNAPPEAVEEFRLRVTTLPHPDTLPSIRDVVVDATGHLWVERYRSRYGEFEGIWEAGPQEWDVFDSTARWLGTVMLPERFEVHDIGTDYVLGVWRDDLDVEQVHLYDLVR